MKKQTPKSDLTRAQIIKGALHALEQAGVTGTTTRKIANEAGVQLSTLHYHFDSKNALLVAVLESLVDGMADRMRQQRVTESPDIDHCIEHMLLNAWRAIQQTKAIQIVQYELTLYALREDAQWLAERQYEAYLRLYRDALMAAQQKAPQLSAANCTALARFILAGLDGLILQELAKPGSERSRRGIDALIAAAQDYARRLVQ